VAFRRQRNRLTQKNAPVARRRRFAVRMARFANSNNQVTAPSRCIARQPHVRRNRYCETLHRRKSGAGICSRLFVYSIVSTWGKRQTVEMFAGRKPLKRDWERVRPSQAPWRKQRVFAQKRVGKLGCVLTRVVAMSGNAKGATVSYGASLSLYPTPRTVST
jgi:hypothetical protein